MPFENFYDESDKAARRWRKILVLAFFLLVTYFTVSLWMVSRFDDGDESENQISEKIERLRRVDELCTNLPKPEKFYFVRRDKPIYNTNATAIKYYYKSDRGIEEIMPTFIVWFGANGWKPAPENEHSFRKGLQTVTIKTNYDDDYYDNYEIYCYEKSFKAYD